MSLLQALFGAKPASGTPPFAPPRISVPRNEAAAAHAVDIKRETLMPEARIFFLSSPTSLSSTSL